MSAKFNEGLVERSYHSLWEECFTKLLAVDGYEVFVPGKEEVHVGFDLGFAKSNPVYKFTGDDFFEWMKQRIADTISSDSAFLYAYFYQYKLTNEVKNINKVKDAETRKALIDIGYQIGSKAFRSKLDTKRNIYANGKKTRPFSQHEALCRLAKIKHADVAYCTPRFLKSDGIPPLITRSLDDLNIIPVLYSTPELSDGKSHYLYYENLLGENPVWCSEPVRATLRNEIQTPKLISPLNFMKMMKANFIGGEGVFNTDFIDLDITDKDLSRDMFLEYLNALPDCTRIVRFDLKKNE